MILIISDKDDVHADVVIEKLFVAKQKYFRLNLDIESLQKTSISYQNFEWKICIRDSNIYSSEIKSVWVRTPFVKLSLEEQCNPDANLKIWKGEWNKSLIGLYFSLRGANWLIPLKEAFRAENKYFQYEVANSVGFNLPSMIVSNIKDELIDFCNSHSEVVLKFMNQEFYKDNDNIFKGIYVNKIGKEDLYRFGNSQENPIVLQNYIEKLYEVRYIVVGDEHFVCKIDSQKSNLANIDWRRYDIPNTPHIEILPPEEIRNNVNLLMKKLELNYGALDFIVNTKNEWYFLEINAMGQYLWIEDLTNLKISNSIMNWLISNNKKD